MTFGIFRVDRPTLSIPGKTDGVDIVVDDDAIPAILADEP